MTGQTKHIRKLIADVLHVVRHGDMTSAIIQLYCIPDLYTRKVVYARVLSHLCESNNMYDKYADFRKKVQDSNVLTQEGQEDGIVY